MPAATKEQLAPGENGNVIFVDPAALIQDNPVALIFNYESLDRMEARFSHGLFLPPHVVRVQTFAGVRHLIVDGMTRAEYAKRHKGEQRNGFSFDQIPVLDMTEEYLQQPRVVLKEDPERSALTMAEYLRAVVPLTVVHHEIATDRIAAHIVNGWKNMVGAGVAERFSALAALSLASKSVLDERIFRRFITTFPTLVRDEQPEERERIDQSLVDVVGVIREANLTTENVAKAALSLVSIDSQTIGGSGESQRQIWGYLHNFEVEAKLQAAYKEPAEQEQARMRLGELLTTAFQNLADKHNRQQVISILQKALEDGDLSLVHVRRVIQDPNPLSAYNEARKDVNEERLGQAYQRIKKDALTDVEERLIALLGRKTHGSEGLMRQNIAALQEAQRVIVGTDAYVAGLLHEAENLASVGIAQERIESEIAKIRGVQVAIFRQEGSGRQLPQELTPASLGKRTRDLSETVQSLTRKINREITIFQIGQLVDEIYGEELTSGFGQEGRASIVGYLSQEFRASNESAIRERIGQLRSLDSQLLSDVLRGDTRIDEAIELQRRKILPQIPPSSAPQPYATPGLPKTEETQGSTHPKSAESPVVPTVPIVRDGQTEVVLVDQAAGERRRIEVNNEKAIKIMQTVREAWSQLPDLDLERDTFAAELQREIKEHFNDVGNIYFGQPDAVRVMEEHMQRVSEDLKKQEARAKAELDSTTRETQTRQ